MVGDVGFDSYPVSKVSVPPPTFFLMSSIQELPSFLFIRIAPVL